MKSPLLKRVTLKRVPPGLTVRTLLLWKFQQSYSLPMPPDCSLRLEQLADLETSARARKLRWVPIRAEMIFPRR